MVDKLIRDLRPGDETVSFFILRKKETKAKHESGEIYLSLELGDRSGRIQGTLWDDVKENSSNLARGDIIKVQGKVITYKDRSHLSIEKIRKVEEKDQVDVTRLVPVTEKDRDRLFEHLNELIANVSHSQLKTLLESIFSDQLIRKRFGDAPAGKLWHHAYLGGLLEHTLSVTDICVAVGKMYPRINCDLLMAGALLHDIGKISSFSFRTLIDYTDEGRLIGHIVQGAQLVREKIASISNFPVELERHLLHLILSHQGKLEQASPVVPMTLEALILYYADEIDSKTNAFLRIEKREKQSGVKWSSYVKLLDRYLYFGEDSSEQE